MTLRNTGEAAVTNWQLSWSFPNGQTIKQMWGGTPAVSGAQVTVTPMSWNNTIAVNGSVGIGFIGAWTGSNTAPTSFTMNGTACTVS